MHTHEPINRGYETPKNKTKHQNTKQRRVSEHTDTPIDEYVSILIDQIKETAPLKVEEKNNPKRQTLGPTGVDLYKGLNGKQYGGWRNIDDYFK